MKRLIKKSYNVYNQGDRVRFINSNKFYEVVQSDLRQNSYILKDSDSEEIIYDVSFNDVVIEGEYIEGDLVLFKNHPYNDTLVFEVKEILADGTYFIESESNVAFTGINGRNLELII